MTRRALASVSLVPVFALALVLVLGCGAAPARPELPTQDACDRYGRALAPALGRIGKAADQFMDRISARAEASARAARELTEQLAEEQGRLRAIRIEARALEERHVRLTRALGELAGAMSALAASIGAGDWDQRRTARVGLERAARSWDEATRRIRDLCPDAGGALETPPLPVTPEAP